MSRNQARSEKLSGTFNEFFSELISKGVIQDLLNKNLFKPTWNEASRFYLEGAELLKVEDKMERYGIGSKMTYILF